MVCIILNVLHQQCSYVCGSIETNIFDQNQICGIYNYLKSHIYFSLLFIHMNENNYYNYSTTLKYKKERTRELTHENMFPNQYRVHTITFFKWGIREL